MQDCGIITTQSLISMPWFSTHADLDFPLGHKHEKKNATFLERLLNEVQPLECAAAE